LGVRVPSGSPDNQRVAMKYLQLFFSSIFSSII
jgi:hypothetical protein